MRITKVYTRSGDAGQTSLGTGERVSKASPRVCAYGEVDETNAAIGLARVVAPADFSDALLSEIQHDLFTIGGALATPAPERLKEGQRTKVVMDHARIEALEGAIDAVETELVPLKAFVLPGGTPKAAALHFARTVCRRAERAVVHLARQEPVASEVLVYLNRLSDLLFVLARLANQRSGVPDVAW